MYKMSNSMAMKKYNALYQTPRTQRAVKAESIDKVLPSPILATWQETLIRIFFALLIVLLFIWVLRKYKV